MPLVYDYTSGSGNEYVGSYWRVRTVSVNEQAKTCSFQMAGWASMADYRAGADGIEDSPQDFSITDPAEYDSRVGTNLRFGSLDEYATTQPFFQNGFLGDGIYSYILALSARIGHEGPSTLDVKFSGVVGAYLANLGVTIKVNGVARDVVGDNEVFSDGYFHIRYTLESPVTLGDVVTWEYDSVPGILTEDSNGYAIITLSPITAENLLGTIWRFNVAENSAHWALLA